jgi:hypothetical protein
MLGAMVNASEPARQLVGTPEDFVEILCLLSRHNTVPGRALISTIGEDVDAATRLAEVRRRAARLPERPRVFFEEWQIVLDFAAWAGRIDRWPRGASEDYRAVGNSPLSAAPSAFASNRPRRSCGSTESNSAGRPNGRKPDRPQDRRFFLAAVRADAPCQRRARSEVRAASASG